MRRALVGLGVAALLAACSGGDKIVGANGKSSTSGSVLSSGDSVYLAGFVSSAAWGAMKQMRTITNVQVTAFGTSRPPCTPLTTVGGGDTNNNGIADDQTTTWSASTCSFLNNGATTTAAGTVRIVDLGTLVGYRVTYTNYTLVATRGDSTQRAVVNGTYEFRYGATTSGSALDNTVLQLESRSSNGSVTLTRTAALTGTLSPTTGAFSATGFPGASMSYSGTLTIGIGLTGNAIVSGQPTDVTYAITLNASTALTSPSSCLSTPGFTTGVIDGTVTGTWRGTLRVSFGSCGSGTSESPGTKK